MGMSSATQDVLEDSVTESAKTHTFRSGAYLNNLFRPEGTRLERRMTELERAKISARIKQARHEAGLTQDELADLLNVQQRSVANYESVRVPWRLISQIAEITGKSSEWLLHGREESDQSLEGRLEELALTLADVRENQEEAVRTLLAELSAIREMLAPPSEAAPARPRRK